MPLSEDEKNIKGEFIFINNIFTTKTNKFN